MAPKTIIAVDPGASNGGIAVLKKGEVIKTVRMPRDLTELNDYFKHLKYVDPEAVAFIEKVQIFSSDATDNPGKQYRIKILLANYEQIKALLVYHGFMYVEVYPQSWQSVLGLNKNKGLTPTAKKNKFKDFAARHFKEIKVNLWNSDALNIILFALIKYDEAPDWILQRLQNAKGGLF